MRLFIGPNGPRIIEVSWSFSHSLQWLLAEVTEKKIHRVAKKVIRTEDWSWKLYCRLITSKFPCIQGIGMYLIPWRLRTSVEIFSFLEKRWLGSESPLRSRLCSEVWGASAGSGPGSVGCVYGQGLGEQRHINVGFRVFFHSLKNSKYATEGFRPSQRPNYFLLHPSPE